MNVSVIICTRNRAESLGATLDAVLPHLQALPDRELIVVDNGSTDETPAVVARFCRNHAFISYLREDRAGQAAARNTGLRHARGEVIVFTDDDVRPSNDWLKELVRPIQHGSTDATVGTVSLASDLLRPWMSPMHRSWLASTEELSPTSPDRLVGANMAFSRAVLNRVPRFEEALGPGAMGYGDDTLFSLELRAAGFRIAYVPGAAVEHRFNTDRLTIQAFAEMAERHGRSDSWIACHWSRSEITWLTPRIIWQGLKNVLHFLRGGFANFDEKALQTRRHLFFLRQYRRDKALPPHAE